MSVGWQQIRLSARKPVAPTLRCETGLRRKTPVYCVCPCRWTSNVIKCSCFCCCSHLHLSCCRVQSPEWVWLRVLAASVGQRFNRNNFCYLPGVVQKQHGGGGTTHNPARIPAKGGGGHFTAAEFTGTEQRM